MNEHSSDALALCAEQSDWVLGLARRLLDAEDLDDDVVQDAALAALRSERRGAPWLVGGVRKLVANRRRQRARRRRVERAGAVPEAQPSAADSAARVEQQRMLAEAVLALDEPFRDVVLLRYYDGLPRREIARRLDLPVATVNSRLARAMHKLRSRLDRSHGGREGWVAAIAPLVAPSSRGSWTIGVWLVKHKVTAAVAGLVVLAVVGWSVGLVGPLGAPEIVADPVSLDAATARADRDDHDTTRSAPERSSLADDGGEEPGGLRVTVVDDATGEPVPAAEVRCADDESMNELRRRALRREDWLDLAFEHGERVGLDEHASFAVEPGQTMFFARHGDRRGFLPLRKRDAGDLQLRLSPLRSVHVRVIDGRGQPMAGVPVTLWGSDGRERTPVTTVYTTIEEGGVRVRWFDGLLDLTFGRRSALQIGLWFPGGEGTFADVGDASDGDTIELVCPAVGSVRVLATRPDREVEDDTVIYLAHEDEAPWQVRLRPYCAFTQNGVGTFWPVGLGLRLQAIVTWTTTPYYGGGPYLRWTRVGGDGPRFDGDEAELRVDARPVVLTGRLVDSAGEPVREASGSVQLLPADDRFGWDARFDDTGLFRFELAPSGELERFEVLKLLLRSPRQAEIEVPLPPLNPPVVDLGDLRVPDVNVLAHGYVVDPDGSPVAGATVQAVTKSGATGWLPQDLRAVQTDAAGRFELEGEPRSEPTWLTVRGSGPWRHEPQPAVPGTNRLTLLDAGALVGRLEIGATEGVERLGVELWPEAMGAPGPDHHQGWIGVQVEPDGSLRATALEAGSYTLAVFLSPREQLARVEGIRVALGEPTAPARLQPLDLRGLLGVVDLRVRDDRGRRIEAEVYGLAGDRSHELGRTGRPIVFAKRVGIDTLVLERDGYFPVDVPAADGRIDVTMTRGLEVALRVECDAVLAKPYSLRVELHPEGPTLGRATRHVRDLFRPDRARLSGGGVAALRVPGAGRYRVRFFVERPGASVDQREVTPELPPVITIADAGELAVSVDGARVGEALASLEAKRR